MESETKIKKRGPTGRVAEAVVKNRYLIFILFAALLIFCAASIGKSKTNGDFSIFLPEGCETKLGNAIMTEEFSGYADAQVMLVNTTYATARAFADEIAGYDSVMRVSFDDTPAHFKGTSALISISFSGAAEDRTVNASMNKIIELAGKYDSYIHTDIGFDYNRRLESEMGGVMLIASIVILAVLTLTSRSFFEPVVYLIVFSAAAVLNMGTNYLLGTISTISSTIAVIMQLALAIDYSIIFMHRYHDEAASGDKPSQAASRALAAAIPEILSSGLTTVTGLVSLTLMQFRLGYDLGVVLTKGILCSMLTVMLLMPGLTVLFARPLAAAVHRPLLPSFEKLGRGVCRARHVFTILFAILIPVGIILSGSARFAFSTEAIDGIVYSEDSFAEKKINSTFPRSTYTALLIPAGDYEKEKILIDELKKIDGATTVLGAAGIDAGGGYRLTDSLTPREFSEVAGITNEQARLLYAAYSVSREDYKSIIDPASYPVPLLDMLEYVFEKSGSGTLGFDAGDRLDGIKSSVKAAKDQLVGTNYDRIIVTTDLPAEGEESLGFVEEMRAKSDALYGSGKTLVIGAITLARDLRDTHTHDSVMTGVLTALFVFLILLVTFRTPVGAAVLVFVIQTCIWLNFSVPAISGTRSFFVTHMIVSAIQMGATIDYAIVIMNRYLRLRETLGKVESAAKAVAGSFPTIATSGSIMAAAGLLIGYRVSDVYVGHIGLAVGRGAIISVVVVTAVLPGLLILLDGAIRKTTLRFRKTEKSPKGE